TAQTVIDRGNIAVSRNRNRYRILDGLNVVPICKAFVALLTRAAVDLDVLDAALLGHLSDVDDVYRRVGITGTHLQSQWDRDRLFDLFENGFEKLRIPEQTRPAAIFYHLWRGAAAVNVENVGTDLF